MADYDPDTLRRFATMAERRARSRDPDLIALARDVIDPPPISDDVVGDKLVSVIKTPQAIEVDRLLEEMVSSVQRLYMHFQI